MLLPDEAQASEVREVLEDREGRGRPLRSLPVQVREAERELEVREGRQVRKVGEGGLEGVHLRPRGRLKGRVNGGFDQAMAVSPDKP